MSSAILIIGTDNERRIEAYHAQARIAAQKYPHCQQQIIATRSFSHADDSVWAYQIGIIYIVTGDGEPEYTSYRDGCGELAKTIEIKKISPIVGLESRRLGFVEVMFRKHNIHPVIGPIGDMIARWAAKPHST